MEIDEDLIKNPRMQRMTLEQYVKQWNASQAQFVKNVKQQLKLQHEEADSLTQQVLTSGSEGEYEEWAVWLHTLIERAIQNEIERLENIDTTEGDSR